MTFTKEQVYQLKCLYLERKAEYFTAGMAYAAKCIGLQDHKDAPDFKTFNINLENEKGDIIADLLDAIEP